MVPFGSEHLLTLRRALKRQGTENRWNARSPPKALLPPEQSRWSPFPSQRFNPALTWKGGKQTAARPGTAQRSELCSKSSASSSCCCRGRNDPTTACPADRKQPIKIPLGVSVASHVFPRGREGRKKRFARQWNVWQPALKEKLVQPPGPGLKVLVDPLHLPRQLQVTIKRQNLAIIKPSCLRMIFFPL